MTSFPPPLLSTTEVTSMYYELNSLFVINCHHFAANYHQGNSRVEEKHSAKKQTIRLFSDIPLALLASSRRGQI